MALSILRVSYVLIYNLKQHKEILQDYHKKSCDASLKV